MIPPIDRGEYGEIFRRHFGNETTRQGIRNGWERWKKIWESELDVMVLHEIDGKPALQGESDYVLFVASGPLGFKWRASEGLFLLLPAMWKENSATFARLFKLKDPRATARLVIQYALIDGRVSEIKLSCAAASAIAWLLSNTEMKLPLNEYHHIGYDISSVPGPLGQARMFNFRAILAENEEQAALQLSRELPLPGWRPPLS
jgi:hypothetical protein